MLKLAHQLLHLLAGKRLSRLDGGALAYGCDKAFFSLGSKWIVSLPQELEYIHQCCADVRHYEYGWHGADKIACSAKWFHGEAHVVEERQVLAKLAGQRGVEV